jgi:hypothetical protein
LRAWIVAPAEERDAVLAKMKPMGGFEGWSERVRGALLWLGESDPCATIDDVIEQEESETKYAALVAGWLVGLGAYVKVGTQEGCDIFGNTDLANETMWSSLDDVIAKGECVAALKTALAEITPREVKHPPQALGTFLKPFVAARLESQTTTAIATFTGSANGSIPGSEPCSTSWRKWTND